MAWKSCVVVTYQKLFICCTQNLLSVGWYSFKVFDSLPFFRLLSVKPGKRLICSSGQILRASGFSPAESVRDAYRCQLKSKLLVWRPPTVLKFQRLFLAAYADDFGSCWRKEVAGAGKQSSPRQHLASEPVIWFICCIVIVARLHKIGQTVLPQQYCVI